MIIDPITKNVDTPELFVYLQEQFGGLSKQDVNQKKEELAGGETAGENKAKEAKDKGRYHGGGSEISKDFSGDQTFNIVHQELAFALIQSSEDNILSFGILMVTG